MARDENFVWNEEREKLQKIVKGTMKQTIRLNGVDEFQRLGIPDVNKYGKKSYCPRHNSPPSFHENPGCCSGEHKISVFCIRDVEAKTYQFQGQGEGGGMSDIYRK